MAKRKRVAQAQARGVTKGLAKQKIKKHRAGARDLTLMTDPAGAPSNFGALIGQQDSPIDGGDRGIQRGGAAANQPTERYTKGSNNSRIPMEANVPPSLGVPAPPPVGSRLALLGASENLPAMENDKGWPDRQHKPCKH